MDFMPVFSAWTQDSENVISLSIRPISDERQDFGKITLSYDNNRFSKVLSCSSYWLDWQSNCFVEVLRSCATHGFGISLKNAPRKNVNIFLLTYWQLSTSYTIVYYYHRYTRYILYTEYIKLTGRGPLILTSI